MGQLHRTPALRPLPTVKLPALPAPPKGYVAFWEAPDWAGGDNLRDPGTSPFWMRDPLTTRPEPEHPAYPGLACWLYMDAPTPRSKHGAYKELLRRSRARDGQRRTVSSFMQTKRSHQEDIP